jgi:hypothetical protein
MPLPNGVYLSMGKAENRGRKTFVPDGQKTRDMSIFQANIKLDRTYRRDELENEATERT